MPPPDLLCDGIQPAVDVGCSLVVVLSPFARSFPARPLPQRDLQAIEISPTGTRLTHRRRDDQGGGTGALACRDDARTQRLKIVAYSLGTHR